MAESQQFKMAENNEMFMPFARGSYKVGLWLYAERKYTVRAVIVCENVDHKMCLSLVFRLKFVWRKSTHEKCVMNTDFITQ
jgi:hypothetical protein